MLFQSSYDPTLKSTQQLIVFCHADQRCLLPLPQSFEDALEIVRDEFGLKGVLQLETQDLSGWDGQRVKIHGGAWKGIAELLRSVSVREVKNDMSESVPQGHIISRLSKASASRRLSSRVISPKSVGSNVQQQLTPSSSVSSRGGRNSPVPRGHEGDNAESGDEPDSAAEKGRRSPTHVSSDEENVDEDMDKAVPKDEEGDVENYPDAPQGEAADIPQPHAEEERELTPLRVEHVSRVFQREDRAAPSRSRSSVSSQSRPQEKPLKSSAEGVKDKAENVKVKAEDARVKAKVKTEKVSVALAQAQSQSQSESQSQDGPSADDRFLISVGYGDGEESLFKTRGRHLVSKVLMQACRTSGIEHLYNRAHMVLIVETEEDGETMEHRFLCSNEDTMARAGAESRSRFVIHIDEDVE
ncbi:hypothetical protein BKA93DRAFT_779941 [Sparassis latifolia]